MYHIYAWYPRKSEESIRSPGPRVTEVGSYYMGVGNQTRVLYKYKKKMFLISEPSLQLPSPNLSEEKLQGFLMCPKIIKYCTYIYFNLKL